MAYTEERFITVASLEYGSLSFVELSHASQIRERSITSPRLVSNFSSTRSDFVPHLTQLVLFVIAVDRVDKLSKRFPLSSSSWAAFIRFGGVLRWMNFFFVDAEILDCLADPERFEPAKIEGRFFRRKDRNFDWDLPGIVSMLYQLRKSLPYIKTAIFSNASWLS
jgi:hypothetical protein